VEQYTTKPFHGTPSDFVRRVAVMWLSRWWWVVALPIAICGVLAINEAMWLFVAMMLLFLLYPGLMMMIYINYAFSPEARHTLYEQTVTISSAGIEINYIEKNKVDKFAVSEILDVECGDKHVVVKFKKPRYSHVSIPLTAIDEAQRQPLFKLISELWPTMA
jgi:hypothetical protein